MDRSSSSNRSRLSIYLSALVLLVIGALALILVYRRTQETREDLQRILHDTVCSRTCWQRIEPDVTTHLELKNSLDDASIDYIFSPGAPGSDYALYQWVPAEEPPVVNRQNRAYVTVTVKNGLVEQVVLPLDICVSRVVDEYGPPTAIEMTEGYTMLIYAEHKLGFWVSPEDFTRVSSAFLVSDASLREWLASGNLRDWNQVSSEFAGDCLDSMSAN